MYGTDIFTSEHIEYLRSIELPKKVFDAITLKNAQKLVPVD
jgi:hypothetical protein